MAQTQPALHLDPVCGREVKPGQDLGPLQHGGREYHFCCPSCQLEFARDPERHLRPVKVWPKGWFGRWLDRLARTNDQTFGQAGPRCH